MCWYDESYSCALAQQYTSIIATRYTQGSIYDGACKHRLCCHRLCCHKI